MSGLYFSNDFKERRRKTFAVERDSATRDFFILEMFMDSAVRLCLEIFACDVCCEILL